LGTPPFAKEIAKEIVGLIAEKVAFNADSNPSIPPLGTI
jgi:hypothetical protein